MKLLIVIFSIAFSCCLAQEPLAETKFHEGSQQFISGNRDAALSSVNQGLMSDPGNPKLTELKKLLEDQKKKEEQQKKDQEKKEKENKDKQNQDQKKDNKDQKDDKNKDNKDNKDQKEQKDKEQQEKEKKEKEEQEKKDAEKEKQDKDSKEKKDIPPSVSDKLKEMQMSEDKAKMILEAMKNQEVQYLQQNKRKATKPKDKGKPDW